MVCPSTLFFLKRSQRRILPGSFSPDAKGSLLSFKTNETLSFSVNLSSSLRDRLNLSPSPSLSLVPFSSPPTYFGFCPPGIQRPLSLSPSFLFLPWFNSLFPSSKPSSSSKTFFFVFKDVEPREKWGLNFVSSGKQQTRSHLPMSEFLTLLFTDKRHTHTPVSWIFKFRGDECRFSTNSCNSRRSWFLSWSAVPSQQLETGVRSW